MKEQEAALVERLRKRQESALQLVIERYGALIRSIIRYHLQDRHAADECLDDVLMAVWTHIDSYDASKNTLVNWIAAVAKYKAIDYQRSYARRNARLLYDAPELERAVVDDAVSEQEWDGLLDHLTPEDKELFIQHYVRDRSVQELAAARGVKHSWIYNRLSRGRKRLRGLLGHLRD